MRLCSDCTSLVWARMFGVPHMHKEEFQLRADMTLEGEEKVNRAASLHDLLWWSTGGRMGIRASSSSSSSSRHAGLEQRGRSPTPAVLRMRDPGFGHPWTLLLLQTCSSRLHGSPGPTPAFLLPCSPPLWSWLLTLWSYEPPNQMLSKLPWS